MRKVEKIFLANSTNLLYHFKKLPKRKQIQFVQCFDCEYLYVCDKDNDNFCKDYIQSTKNKSESFIDVFNKELQKIIKENENA